MRPWDWVVDKDRPDALLHTKLDQMPRANGVETVVVLGFITEGCVESTVRAVSCHDYCVVAVEGVVASPDAVLHEGPMRLLRARYTLAGADAVLEHWRAAVQHSGDEACHG